jgi:hypothetical protein
VWIVEASKDATAVHQVQQTVARELLLSDLLPACEGLWTVTEGRATGAGEIGDFDLFSLRTTPACVDALVVHEDANPWSHANTTLLWAGTGKLVRSFHYGLGVAKLIFHYNTQGGTSIRLFNLASHRGHTGCRFFSHVLFTSSMNTCRHPVHMAWVVSAEQTTTSGFRNTAGFVLFEKTLSHSRHLVAGADHSTVGVHLGRLLASTITLPMHNPPLVNSSAPSHILLNRLSAGMTLRPREPSGHTTTGW